MGDLVPVQAGGPVGFVERLARVGSEVPGCEPRFLERTQSDRQITEELDVHAPATPCLAYERVRHVAADRKVTVQAVSARMPLGHP